MSGFQHTPGPWRAHTDKANRPGMLYRGNVCLAFMAGLADHEYAAVSASAGEIGADVSDADLYRVHQANAHLVAAAPDLLAARKAEIDTRGHLSGGCAVPAGADGCSARCEVVRAAIAKAEGRRL